MMMTFFITLIFIFDFFSSRSCENHLEIRVFGFVLVGTFWLQKEYIHSAWNANGEFSILKQSPNSNTLAVPT